MVNVIWFNEISKYDSSKVGQKAVVLAELFNNRFPVPSGFSVTAEAFENFLEANKSREKINNILQEVDYEDSDKLEKASEKIQEILLAGEIPGEVKRDITVAYESMNIDPNILASKVATQFIQSGRDYPFVAIRGAAIVSSSVNGAEDTYLNVKGSQNVVEAVKRCWMSLFSTEALYSRYKSGIDNKKVGMSIIVQKMINSEKSGIVFTINPSDNDRTKSVVEAAYGFGDSIISGSISPDRYVINKSNLDITERSISIKNWMNTRDQVTGRTIKRDLPHEKAITACLSDDEVSRVSNLARRIETFYGVPQHVEFAVENGRIHIVQSKPLASSGKENTRDDIVKAEEKKEVVSTVSTQKTLETKQEDIVELGFGSIKIQVPRNSKSIERAINLLRMLEEEIKE